MTERYSEFPPNEYFEGLDDVKTLDDLNLLAQMYEFQVNSMADDPEGKQEMTEEDLHQQINTSVGMLKYFAKKLGVFERAIEITGVGIFPGSAMGEADTVLSGYEVFRGQYLGFGVRVEGAVQESDLVRYEIGHMISVGSVSIQGFLRDRNDKLRVFVPASAVELIETPEMRKQRLVQQLAEELENDDPLAEDLDLVLYADEEQVDLQSLGLLFDHYDVRYHPEAMQETFIKYIDLQTGLVDGHITIVSPWVVKPAPQIEDSELIPVRGDIYGAVRGFCFAAGIDFDSPGGPEHLEQPHLYLAVEVSSGDLRTVMLVPAAHIEAYEIETPAAN